MTAVNASTRLARLTAAALRTAGVRHVVLCPGSRSAPLAYELQRVDGSPHLHVRHDERVAAFTALGAAGAVVTTSGTAAANLHPAVLEAHHSRRPLVAITADRPPELRGTWANQTSELQADLFGAAVRARLDLADTDAEKDPDAALRALVDTVASARRFRGPVHLDLGFSEPLVPDDVDDEWSFEVSTPDAGASPSPRPVSLAPDGRRTLVVAGDGAGPEARLVARTAGWPLLAEPSSGVAGAGAVAGYRLLLELPELGGQVERVVVYGRPTLSRPVTQLVSRPDVELVLVSAEVSGQVSRDVSGESSGGGGWPDPGRPAQRVARLDPAALSPPADDGGWARRWAVASAASRQVLDTAVDEAAASDAPSGLVVAREVAAAARPGEALLAAASNPIRDLDLVGHVLPDGLRVLSNRGLSGIDGTVSTASGVALDGGLVRVLVGDLAFLHDLNGLLVPTGEARPHLQVVVVNDDGGGIFGLLDQGELASRGAAERAVFERLFGTPHGADLAALCAGYAVPHQRADALDRLRAALAEPPAGTSVVEVRTTRAGLRQLHERLRAAVHAGVRRALELS